MNKEQEKRLRFIAKMIAIHGYRNSSIENIHSGIVPQSKTGDYSDVTVVTPFGDIPWKECSKINDIEMRNLNKEICNRIYTLLYFIETNGIPTSFEEWGNAWDEPELLKNWLK